MLGLFAGRLNELPVVEAGQHFSARFLVHEDLVSHSRQFFDRAHSNRHAPRYCRGRAIARGLNFKDLDEAKSAKIQVLPDLARWPPTHTKHIMCKL